ncbi:hypothetical protein Cgig2_023279 [Carnegiea gigantea]|uniref:FLZ-type domain-containing protein n=1 Tax=Carnegiea gigantea TaxID=171969 RepID=A0A9Q1Q777_9CARY|nr:hypothetical protein Cgig2_023279 [Carnegiea gigantea]
MLGKRSRPTIGKLAGALRSGIVDLTTSPRSPLEFKTMSPRGLKNYDQGGVGLGIVVALDKSSNGPGRGEILAKYALCCPLSTPSSPIPVSPGSAKNTHGINSNDSSVEMMEGLEEELTYVTCHGPNNSITTRVYYEDGKYGNTVGCNRGGFSGGVGRNFGVFKIPPARILDDQCGSDSYFLSFCHLCRKTLHGKDIYMYRGEKAFCSAECRQTQIVIDERKEQCRLKASKSRDVSTSPYTCTTSRGQVFSPGIVAV